MIERSLARLAIVAWGLAGCAAAPEGDGSAVCPPNPDPAVLASLPYVDPLAGNPERGVALFERECAKCHSRLLAARGSRFFRAYPRLDCREYLARASDAYLLTVIAEGGPAVGRDDAMKPFRDVLNDSQLADLIAHLRVDAR